MSGIQKPRRDVEPNGQIRTTAIADRERRVELDFFRRVQAGRESEVAASAGLAVRPRHADRNVLDLRVSREQGSIFRRCRVGLVDLDLEIHKPDTTSAKD